MEPIFDLAVIGGGVNGCGIARDAAGRGLKTLLCERGDLAEATSSASTKLIHGGLRYLEHYAFRLVRHALAEREILWANAPHIIWPMRFVLPYRPGLRPAWMLRTGLFLYDHIGGRKQLPPTRTLRLDRDEAGAPLKGDAWLGFEYSDCWVQDARLVVLNARDAEARGAEIHVRTACLGARRDDGVWAVTLESAAGRREVRAPRARQRRGALGRRHAQPLIEGARTPANVRLVKGSHIVVPKLYAHEQLLFLPESRRPHLLRHSL